MLDLNQIRYPVRYTTFFLALGGLCLSVLILWASGQGWVFFFLCLALSAVGVHDMLQTHHAILRNYPILGHMRFLLEFIRPEIRQYFLESDSDGTPFNRSKRAIAYQRAKRDLDKRPFGTQQDVYGGNYGGIKHSRHALVSD